MKGDKETETHMEKGIRKRRKGNFREKRETETERQTDGQRETETERE